MDIERLKQKILDLAIRGKLVPQDPNDESAIELVERIRKEKEKLAKEGKIKLSKNDFFIFKGSDNCYYEKNYKISDLVNYVQPTQYIVESTDYDDTYPTPVLTPGKSFILGYTNETDGIFVVKDKVIIFDDFTTASRLVDFDFKVKSSAMKILVVKNENIIDTNYFYYLLQHINYVPYTHKRHWISIFEPMIVTIPPLWYQRIVAGYLDVLFSKLINIDVQRINLGKIIEQIKFEILNYYFGENSCYKSYYSTIKPLSELSETITKGSTPTTYGYSFLKEGINFIKVENIKNYAIDHATITCFISNECHEFQKRSQLKANDILISIAGTIGRIGVVKKCDVPANTNQAFAIVSGYDKNIVPEYLKYYLVWYINSKSNSLGHGGGMLNLTLTEIKNIQIKLPDNFQIQHKIVDKIDAILNTLNSINF